MARKGNRQRNGLDHSSPNPKHAVAESVGASLSDNKKGKSKAQQSKGAGSDLLTGDHQSRSTSPSGERLSKSNSAGNSKKNKQRSGKVSSEEKPENETSSIPQSSDTPNQARDPAEVDLQGASESEIVDDILHASNSNLRGTARRTSKEIPTGVTNEPRTLEAVVRRSIRIFAIHVNKVAEGWLEHQKPRIKALTAALSYAHIYVSVKVEYAYPIIRTWALTCGNLMLALSLVLIDCNIRGLDSLLRLGTTAFLTVLWCSILSVTSMVGIIKMLMILVIVALVAAFVGFTLAALTTAIIAITILWFYGSFWVTGFVIFLGGVILASRHERVALLVTTLYSLYCARSYVGWLGLLFGLNLAFISSDVLVHLLKNASEYRSNVHQEEGQDKAGPFSSEPSSSSPVDHAFQSTSGRPADRSQGIPSTSGGDAELTSEDEVVRLLSCSDHYSAVGLNRYEEIDVSSLKREYRKKAMLVHPDKNMGNEKAAEAFKKLQNAYEVLLDSLKRKTYDDELRQEELLDYLRRFQRTSPKNGRHGIFGSFKPEDQGSHGESRRIACKKCSDFHIWTRIERSKSQARWCQNCGDFHQAKDGDGWVEQSSQMLLFGLFQKMDPPRAYVCAESRIYDATEWFVCQGMRCPANTHKPSFQVNTSVMPKHSAKGAAARGGGGATPDMDESMTEEELFEWLQNAVQSGMFEASNTSNETPFNRPGSAPKGNVKKRKGKQQR